MMTEDGLLLLNWPYCRRPVGGRARTAEPGRAGLAERLRRSGGPVRRSGLRHGCSRTGGSPDKVTRRRNRRVSQSGCSRVDLPTLAGPGSGLAVRDADRDRVSRSGMRSYLAEGGSTPRRTR